MNKRITVKNNGGKTLCCILDGSKDFEKQFNLWLCGDENPRNGICVRIEEDEVALVDYYHDERITTFNVISIEDTENEPQLKWIELENDVK